MSKATLFALTVLIVATALPAYAQRWDSHATVENHVSVGRARTLWSSTLQEARQVLIALPPNYERSGKSYPVLYLLDAEMQFMQAAGTLQFLGTFNERIPEMILVGVVNTDRWRDFLPPAQESSQRDKFGRTDADGFLKFLAGELVPWVEQRYRTAPYRVLVGHSFGALFNTHAMIHRPELFQAHIAISPSLWYDDGAPVARTETGIRSLSSPPALFVTWADHEEDIQVTTEKLVKALTRKPPAGLRWAHRYYRGDDHMSTPHRALYDGLEWLFDGWRMPWREQMPSLDEVEAHYEALSRRFGYPIAPTAAALTFVAGGLVEQGKTAEAIEVLSRAARDYPYLADTHRQLGRALQKAGRNEEALRAYEQALRVALDDDSPFGNSVGDYRGDPVAEYRAKVKELGGAE